MSLIAEHSGSDGAGDDQVEPWPLLLRREPFRILFPLGLLLSWAGVSHWLLYAVGVLLDYQPIFHAMAQIQGFLMCFAVGFLFTMIPRRTGTAPPSFGQVGVAIVAPVATTAFAWFHLWAYSQLAWITLALTVIFFVFSRFRASNSARRPPNSFVWIPVGLLMGISGSLLTALLGVLGPDFQWAHEVGRGLLLQGMFTAFVLGVGGLALPLMTRGDAPADATASLGDSGARLLHLLGAAVLVGSFWVGYAHSLRVAYAMRGAVVLLVLLIEIQLWRLPRGDGWNRWVVWLAGWMLPLGFWMAALFPLQHKAGLHLVFIGGYALLALAVSTHVTLGHGGYLSQLEGKTWQVAATAALLVAAIIPRALMEFDHQHFEMWMAAASFLFLVGTLNWMVFLLPKFVARPQP
jgi:uncharacterized protein involved in response to NO